MAGKVYFNENKADYKRQLDCAVYNAKEQGFETEVLQTTTDVFNYLNQTKKKQKGILSFLKKENPNKIIYIKDGYFLTKEQVQEFFALSEKKDLRVVVYGIPHFVDQTLSFSCQKLQLETMFS